MTEADILSVRNELTDIVVSVVSVSFAMVSAYIVGLWLVLKRAPLILRALPSSYSRSGWRSWVR